MAKDTERMRAGRQMLGLAIRGRRQRASLSLSQLSDLCGLSIGHISDIERGRHLPSLDSLDALGTALGTQPRNLLRDVYPWGSNTPPE